MSENKEWDFKPELQTIKRNTMNGGYFFTGKIKGDLTIDYENRVPYGYSTRHLDSRIFSSGIRLISCSNDYKRYNFEFNCINFYIFLQYLEYIRNYSKERGSIIQNIIINITELNNERVLGSD